MKYDILFYRTQNDFQDKRRYRVMSVRGEKEEVVKKVIDVLKLDRCRCAVIYDGEREEISILNRGYKRGVSLYISKPSPDIVTELYSDFMNLVDSVKKRSYKASLSEGRDGRVIFSINNEEVESSNLRIELVNKVQRSLEKITKPISRLDFTEGLFEISYETGECDIYFRYNGSFYEVCQEHP